MSQKNKLQVSLLGLVGGVFVASSILWLNYRMESYPLRPNIFNCGTVRQGRIENGNFKVSSREIWKFESKIRLEWGWPFRFFAIDKKEFPSRKIYANSFATALMQGRDNQMEKKYKNEESKLQYGRLVLNFSFAIMVTILAMLIISAIDFRARVVKKSSKHEIPKTEDPTQENSKNSSEVRDQE